MNGIFTGLKMEAFKKGKDTGNSLQLENIVVTLGLGGTTRRSAA
jgi:hypothetical protein